MEEEFKEMQGKNRILQDQIMVKHQNIIKINNLYSRLFQEQLKKKS